MHSLRYYVAALLLAFVALPVQAQEARLSTGAVLDAPVQPTLSAKGGGITFTANESTEIAGGGVSCAYQEFDATTENYYLRAFVLADYIDVPIRVTDVEIGASWTVLDEFTIVETTVSLHKLVGEPEGFPDTFTFDDAPLEAATTLEFVGDGAELLLAEFGEGAVFTPQDTLVVAFFTPDGLVDPDPDAEGDEFASHDVRYGQNGEGQEGPTYLATDTACGGLAPTDVALLGEDFATLHWVVVVNGVEAQVANESDVVLPRQVSLGQSYPNPFARRTEIPFTVREAADVSITVFDALGRQVREVAAGTYAPGEYAVPFAATDLPAGLYTYRLQTGDEVQVRKMVLLND